MRGITIVLNGESVHTGNDLDLIQEVKEIGKPDIQSYTVEVPGRNGLLNLTKGLTGGVAFYNRTLKFRYFGTGTRAELLEIDTRMSYYHGETVQIIDDDYPNYYYEGEVSVDTELYGNYIIVNLTVDAQPFRYARNPLTVTKALNGTVSISLNNKARPVMPVITVNAETTIKVGDTTVRISAGTYVGTGALVLKRGYNTWTVTGNGTIEITYREEVI